MAVIDTLDPLLSYLTAASHPLLTRAEEAELARRKDEGDEDAKRRLVESNLRLVYSIARQNLWMGVPLLDLIQEGNLGLIHAIEKFDHRRGYKLSTYATWWIRSSMQRAHAASLEVPFYAYVDRQRVASALYADPDVTDEQMAGTFEITPARVRRARESRPRLSLDTPGEDGRPLLETLEDETVDLDAPVLSQAASEALRRLPARQRLVLKARFGLDGHPEETLAEVSRRLGVSRERVRQIEAQALKKLREILDA